ncbi:helicase-associated domain-containing protein [Tomitella fengzijianii]|uniref:DNA-binding protein n=1 Tax=Tomitella fengzijianii TaxID=2597660 RepID=A0A516X1K3_9ACTN|nr:helicase-associated domain-containing protein [Tomitella fengzijianii]QDQ96966.1 DNA-binding protein [Tomitella fengzijianii]
MATESAADPEADHAADGGGIGLAEWLRRCTDDDLALLVRLRPDLAVAPPASTSVLADRAAQRMSVHRAAENHDTLAMAVLGVLAHADADTAPVHVDAVHDALDEAAGPGAVDRALGALRAAALVWGHDGLEMAPAAREVLPSPPAAFAKAGIVDHGTAHRGDGGDSAGGGTAAAPDGMTARLESLPDDERSMVDALLAGGGLGRTRAAAHDAPQTSPVQRLIRAGLLEKVDEHTVRLPDAVRSAAGSLAAAQVRLTPPPMSPTVHDPATVDATAAGEAAELLRHAGAVLDSLGAHPVPVLRSGGVGVREIRRLAKELSLAERRIGFLLEVLARADLIRSGLPDPVPEHDAADSYWAPSTEIDAWLSLEPAARWAVLARTWLRMPRRIWEIGTRDAADKVVPALAAELTAPGVVADREAVLGRLAAEPAGTGIGAADLLASLRWLRPRRHARMPLGYVEYLLAEAQDMGVVAQGALSAPGRGLTEEAGTDERADPAAAAMQAAMPEPVDHVLLQADLTMIAPGPLVPELAAAISRVAEVESAGAATVYRLTEDSLRAGLDSGMSGSELHELFAGASRTPVPQALTYLIDDVARRYGRLRIGFANAFLRCEDEVLLSEVLTRLPDLGLRRLAPTVAVCGLELADLMEVLRRAGIPAVGEDAKGGVLDLRPRGARVATPRRTRQNVHRPRPAALGDADLAAIVAGMRAGDKAEENSGSRTVRADGTRAGGAATVSLLQTATRTGRTVTVGYVDAQGTAIHRLVEPLAFNGGVLEALDTVTGARHAFSLHRITSVSLAD